MFTKRNKKIKYFYNKFTKKRKYKHNKKGKGSQENDFRNNYEEAKIRTDNILKKAIDDRKKLQKNLETYKKITVRKKKRRQSKRLLVKDPVNYNE